MEDLHVVYVPAGFVDAALHPIQTAQQALKSKRQAEFLIDVVSLRFMILYFRFCVTDLKAIPNLTLLDLLSAIPIL